MTGDRAGESGTSHKMAYDGNLRTFFNSTYSDWQYIQIDFNCAGAFSGLRRYMSRATGDISGARGAQGETVSYSLDGTTWTDFTSNTTTGWQNYVNYGANKRAWHTVPYGWSAWLSLNTPVQARYVRFRWDDNLDVVNDIDVKFVAQPPRNPVAFQMPADPLFVGSYTRIPVKVELSSGLTMDKLEFIVDLGPAAGIVSVSPERTANPLQPMILLGAGYRPGTNYTLLAREVATGRIVGKGQFAVTALWRNHAEGPSFWFTGATGGMPVGGFAWGGGPPSGPQNINVAPAVGTRKIAVVLIDSPTARFDPQEVPTVLRKWRNEIVNGVPDAGRLRSVAHFHREVSHFNSGPSGLNLEADFFGPVTMPATWDNYFGTNGWRIGSTWQSMVTEADPLIDYSQYKHVIFATKSIPSWPQADWGPPTYTTAEGNLTFGVFSMPYN